MNNEETIKLLAAIAAAYPREQAFRTLEPEMVKLWGFLLRDIPYNLASMCVSAHVASSPFPPAISDIRGWAAKAEQGADSGEEAWGRVMTAMKHHGWNDPAGAREAMGPAAWEAVQRCAGTWQDLCASENVAADRAHFIRIYNAKAKREQDMGKLPPAVRQALLQGNCKRLMEGTL